jgi:hypothetical protein
VLRSGHFQVISKGKELSVDLLNSIENMKFDINLGRAVFDGILMLSW